TRYPARRSGRCRRGRGRRRTPCAGPWPISLVQVSKVSWSHDRRLTQRQGQARPCPGVRGRLGGTSPSRKLNVSRCKSLRLTLRSPRYQDDEGVPVRLWRYVTTVLLTGAAMTVPTTAAQAAATDADLAYRWASVHYQDTASTYRADYVAPVDYDGDWN